MTVHVENLIPDFLAFWEQSQDLSLPEQKRLWQTLYEELHRDVFDVYYSRWGNPARLEEALLKFPEVVPRLPELSHNIQTRIAGIVTRCARLFAAPEIDLDVVVMVGSFTSNGWLTFFRGKPTVFLALECFATPRYLELLIAHELAHGFHAQCSATPWAEFAIGEALFGEGLAIVASANICPDATEEETLWFKTGYADWLAECAARWPELRRRFLADLAKIDEPLYASYFGEKGPAAGLPKRAGYFVGARVIQSLSQQHTLAELARWSPERAVAETRRTLEGLTGPG
ncbi:MAG: DUF2268 domain-containing putative Zn-dependent protease [Chloroflexota bacterium]|nr:DUF2268 domain-containing putative Zn-dependent protease [Chloroflexota bacterium]